MNRNMHLCFLLILLFSFAPKQKTIIAGDNILPDPACQVIELFTSEGCSSCPAADKLLESISQTYQHKVVVLGFHVDYWNRLGWKDRFSNSEYAERQRRYATMIPKGETYTPQAVVNGTEQMVGSDEKLLVQSINQASLKRQPINLVATAKMDGKSVQIMCDFPAGNDHQLNVAVIQTNAETQVLAGENKGKTLRHINVVRAFMTISKPIGMAFIELPEKIPPKDCRVVVFVQDRKTMRIIGATDYLTVQ